MTAFVGQRESHMALVAGQRWVLMEGLVPRGPGELVKMMRIAMLLEVVQKAIRVDMEDVTSCKCRVHEIVKCGATDEDTVETLGGCEWGVPGTAPFIHHTQQFGREAWAGDPPPLACLAEPGTRVLDGQFAHLIAERAFMHRRLVDRISGGARKRYGTGSYKDMACFGAGYCFLWPCDEDFRARASRVLGPKTYLVLAAALASAVGIAQGNAVDLIRVGRKMWHVEPTNESVPDVALDFIIKAGKIISQFGMDVKVGASKDDDVDGEGLQPSLSIDYDKLAEAMARLDRKRVERSLGVEGKGIGSASFGFVGPSAAVDTRVVRTVESYIDNHDFSAFRGRVEKLCGHKVPKSGLSDLAIARFCSATVPPAFVGGKDKLKTLSNVGDAALLLCAMIATYKVGGPMQSMQHYRQTVLTDKMMGSLMARSVLAPDIVLDGNVTLDSSVGAKAYEAIAGVLCIYCTKGAVETFARSTGLVVISGVDSEDDE